MTERAIINKLWINLQGPQFQGIIVSNLLKFLMAIMGINLNKETQASTLKKDYESGSNSPHFN